MGYIENRTFDELKIGDFASLKRTLTEKDIELFSIMSGDVNPAHVDAEYAKDTQFHKIIAQGMWGASLISTVLGTELPGPGTIYLDQTLKFTAPVVPGDTVTITVTVLEKIAENHRINLDCKCINQQGETVIAGIATVIAPTQKVKRECVELPKVVFQKPKDSWYKQLIKMKKSYAPLKTAVVHPVDALSLQGAIDAAEEHLIVPILIGPVDKIQSAAKEANINLSSYEIVPTKHSHEAAEVAVKMIKEGKAEAIMKGKIHTDELMTPIVDKEKGLRTGRRMSHVFSLETPNYFKPLFLTDAAINIQPNLQTKKDIVQNAIDLFRRLGLGQPKVAILSAVETVNEKIPSTLDATALCKMAERGQITGGIVDGPLAFDNAISIESAREKGIYSQVAGNADILVVPDLEAGNMLYKQMTFLSGIEAAGIVIGARVPIILTSRSSDGSSRKASCAMALIYARNQDFINE
ncbi:bifunctional enoyl-CoA hydratase/phosphate acetyltransferase [Legionella longbeachae]|uniref:Putative phosphate acetyl/butaryl transferase n=1 Tax=Legionella longbeachae serogroup 1 (strain NSW150) TaxID=661367 RepID=D3HK16_LEGLN|nr:bifunctional enoyl-CoA hydratase/phosphate acetyltransferase [Legionella longbeachae]VEE03300.1 phosphate acetyl/butaryl transferase [Legionella oakridgensis]HBD7399150.1 bifunctional enoyl-CoA hydratase/phosphate acetyltransferase [Legionella pneumophila]ARB93804.1 enoyl-CoA hydratase [Legionella longbeachae]ARM33056.1 bifunctional enoyl-CoA hydratase/phosphate acetyltransferase [Legionella longbeachae]EEZ94111.1 phosphate acetyltransferase [Legionella longbeachae D-4968]